MAIFSGRHLMLWVKLKPLVLKTVQLDYYFLPLLRSWIGYTNFEKNVLSVKFINPDFGFVSLGRFPESKRIDMKEESYLCSHTLAKGR